MHMGCVFPLTGLRLITAIATAVITLQERLLVSHEKTEKMFYFVYQKPTKHWLKMLVCHTTMQYKLQIMGQLFFICSTDAEIKLLVWNF